MNKPSRTLNRLNMAVSYKLCTYLANEHACGHILPGATYQSIADTASAALSIQFTRHNIEGAMQTIGITLPGAPRRVKVDEAAFAALQDRVEKLEQELKQFKLALGA